MIICFAGLHGTGKSTIGKKVAKAFRLDYYSTGDAFRELAKEMNMTLENFTDYVEKHPEIDKKLDDKVVEMSKKDNIVLDAQLSGYLLESIADFKILLSCPLETRVRRMAERDKTSYEKKLEETRHREKSELERFKDLYHIDLSDKKGAQEVYDAIIETENLSINEVTEKVINLIKSQKS